MQSMLMKIVIVNVAVFLVLRITAISLMLGGVYDGEGVATGWVSVPSNLWLLLHRPWTLVTYMFSQYDFLHLLFNMLWLYWFGMVFMMMSTGRRMMGLYLLGGLGGAALYLLFFNTMPLFSGVGGYLIGSSASVIAIVAATAVMAPDFRMNLFFFGSVSLKWIAIITIGIDLLSVNGANAGGHIAHIGGAAVGVGYALLMKQGRDITSPLNRLIDLMANLFKKKRYKAPKIRKTPKNRPNTAKGGQTDTEIIDTILDKIKKSGYSSLTPEERRRLFESSKNIK